MGITRFMRKISLVARRTGSSIDGTVLSLVARRAGDPIDSTVLSQAGDPIDGIDSGLVERRADGSLIKDM